MRQYIGVVIIYFQGERAAKLMFEHSRYNECTDVEGFIKDFGSLVHHFRQDSLTLGKVQVGSLLSQVFSLLATYKVKMETRFASVILAIFVLEGLGRSLDPEVDILEKARPVLIQKSLR